MARIRVGIDVRKLGDGGIGEYIRETLIAARAVRPDLEIVAFGTPGAEALLPLDRVDWVKERAARFSWAEAAEKTLSVYDEVLANP